MIASLASQLEQLEIKHDVVLIQLANLRAAHMKATAQATHQNVERLEAELAAMRKEQHAAMEEHRRLAEQHSETLKIVENLTHSRKKLEQELETERNLRNSGSISLAPGSCSGDDQRKNSNESRSGATPATAASIASPKTAFGGGPLGGKGRRYSTSRGSSGSSRGSSRSASRIDNGSGGASSSRPASKGNVITSDSNGTASSASIAILKMLTNDSMLCSIPLNTWKEWVTRARAVNLDLDQTFDVDAIDGIGAGVGAEFKKTAAAVSTVAVDAPNINKNNNKKKATGKNRGKGVAGDGIDAQDPSTYIELAKNMTTNPVARLFQKALSAMEIASGLDAAAIEASKDASHKKKIPFTTNKSGVPIEELRRLMNRPPPWNQPAPGALRKERQDSVKVTTSDETGITEFRSDNDILESKKKGKKKAEDVRLCYFVGRGIGENVPEFLRFNGRVRNRHLSKAQVERIVRLVWVRKEQQRNKDKLSDFFLNEYLKKDFGPSMTLVAEQAYNIVHALERFQSDADCDMFLKILMGLLPEQAFVDQQLLLRKLQVGGI